LNQLRLPFFIAAIIAFVIALLVEVAAKDALGWFHILKTGAEGKETPGFAITYLALIDGLIAYSLAWMVAGLVIPRSVTGRAQGIVSLIISIFAFLGTLALIFITFALLMLMISLLLAIPFGTIAYLAAWGHFAVGAAASTLALVMLLKIVFCVCLVLAQQRFLENKGLVIIICLSLGMTWVIAFVHALLPGVLVSIGDAAVALVITIIATIWLLIMVIGSIVATVKAIISLKDIA
jgi:hypothetical protein